MSTMAYHALRTAALSLFALSPGLLGAQQRDSTRDTVVLEPVVIRAVAPERVNVRRTLTATKTDRLLRDVPQAVTVLSASLMLDQSMQSMTDVARFMPGVTMGLGEGHRDAPTIRGQSSTADFYIDGVRDDAQYLRDLYNVDRVEALKGSNAMVFGRGGGGGVINRVTKQAQWEPVRDITIEGGSYAHKRTTVDYGRGLTPGVAARVTGMFEASDQFRDATNLDRFGVNPTVAIGAGESQLRLGFEHFSDKRTVNRGIPSFQGLPSPSNIATFFGDPGQSHSRNIVDAADATFERRFGGIRLRNHLRFARYDKFYQNVFAGGAVNPAMTQVSLQAYNNATLRSNLFNQTDLTYAILSANAAVKNTFLVGVELARQSSTNFRNTGFFNNAATSYTVAFADPMVSVPVTFRQSAADADNHGVATVGALYAQHELTLGSHWQTVVGLRYDRFHLGFTNNRNDQHFARRDVKFSPRAGLVFKPVEPISFYGTYSVSFLPSSGDQFGSLTLSTETLEPEQFRNREVGFKWDWSRSVTVTAAAYRLNRSNTSAPDPSDVTKVVQTGEQRTTGFEATIAGTIGMRWQLVAGYSVQDAKIVSRTSAAQAGALVPLVPHSTLSVWNRYQFIPALGLGLGVVRQDDMFAAIDNTVTLPGFTRFDAAAFITISERLHAQINIENLFNTTYYATSHGNNNIMPGAPRSVRVGMSID
jgi:catecholate siderophore receptor